ncbi:MAG: chemotaxis protein CheC [Gammaproteobacteria bacterium]|nr:chemotaxis protein CheC [Gammaproteobacteria bacterium]
MTNSVNLDPLEEDFLIEIFNLGIGQAAASLSMMLQQEIEISVPEVRFIKFCDVSHHINASHDICCVTQSMESDFEVQSMLLFPEENSLEIVRCLMKESFSDEMILELQQEAILEIGNIVLNACIASFSKAIQVHFKIAPPLFEKLDSQNLSHSTFDKENVVFFVKVNLHLSESLIDGNVLFILKSESMRILQQKLHAILLSL